LRLNYQGEAVVEFAARRLARHNISVNTQHLCFYDAGMNSSQAKRFLAKQGCTFEPAKGGHLLVRRGKMTTVLPQHGGRRDLGKGLWNSILKDLGLKEK